MKKITLNNPCPEQWDHMEPTQQGAFCHACAKEVVDFTKMSHQEIIQTIEQNQTRVCGRLSVHQLDRITTTTKATKGSTLFKVMAGFLALGLPLSTVGQNDPKAAPIVEAHSDQNPKEQQETNTRLNPRPDSSRNVIQGTVVDAHTKETVPFAKVILKNTPIQTETNFDGQFRLVIPDSLLAKRIVLQVMFLGYTTKEIRFRSKDLPLLEVHIPLKQEPLRLRYIGWINLTTEGEEQRG